MWLLIKASILNFSHINAEGVVFILQANPIFIRNWLPIKDICISRHLTIRTTTKVFEIPGHEHQIQLSVTLQNRDLIQDSTIQMQMTSNKTNNVEYKLHKAEYIQNPKHMPQVGTAVKQKDFNQSNPNILVPNQDYRQISKQATLYLIA